MEHEIRKSCIQNKRLTTGNSYYISRGVFYAETPQDLLLFLETLAEKYNQFSIYVGTEVYAIFKGLPNFEDFKYAYLVTPTNNILKNECLIVEIGSHFTNSELFMVKWGYEEIDEEPPFVPLDLSKVSRIENVVQNQMYYGFIHKDRCDSDRKLFFGNIVGDIDEPIYLLDDTHTMVDICVACGVFPSKSVAKKNGWDKPIPTGYNEICLNKKKRTMAYIVR